MEKKRRKKVTLQDIAEYTGVSISTVSHVINKTASISPEVEQRIQEAINSLGYVPRAVSDINKGLRSIAVFVPDISNEFYAKSVQAIIDAAKKHDYTVMLCATKHQPLTESRYVRNLIQNGICGIIFFGGDSGNENMIISASKKVPVVLGDRRLQTVNLDSVETDNTDAMKRCIRKLFKAGYNEIGYITEDLHMTNIRNRYTGFIAGMEENGIHINKHWIICDEMLRFDKSENAYELLYNKLQVMKKHPQIMICSSDLIAVGLLSALRLLNLNVPKDMGIIGFDNISIAKYTNPSLTTISQNMRLMGKQCFDILLERIQNKKRPIQNVVIKATLITRESVKL